MGLLHRHFPKRGDVLSGEAFFRRAKPDFVRGEFRSTFDDFDFFSEGAFLKDEFRNQTYPTAEPNHRDDRFVS